jgi:hypothetical protein
MLYATHVMTTLIPILSVLVFGEDEDMPTRLRPSLENVILLCSFYAPYFLIPFLLLLRMAFCELDAVGGSSVKNKIQ